jgi:hypothetical protein
LELLNVDAALVHDVEVPELLVQELVLVDVLGVLLLDLVSELLVKST